MVANTFALFSMWFHATVLDIFRPYLGDAHNLRQRMKSPASFHSSFSSSSSSSTLPTLADRWISFSGDVFKASSEQLKQMCLLYCLERPPDDHCPYTGWSTTQVMGVLMRDDPEFEGLSDDWRYCLMLFLHFWQHLAVHYTMYRGMSQATLAMALHNGLLTGPEARRLMEATTVKGHYRRHREQVPTRGDKGHDASVSAMENDDEDDNIGMANQVPSGAAASETFLIIDHDTAVTDIEAARIAYLSQQFSDSVMFDELTVNEDYIPILDGVT